MTQLYSSSRLASAALVVSVAVLFGAQAALAQYNFVQDTDGTGAWDDPANWTGGPAGTFPNAAGATAHFTAPVRSTSGAYTLSFPASPATTTVGSITIDNSAHNNASNVNFNGGELIFQSNTADPAKYTETAGTAPSGPGRYTINAPIRVLSDLEVTAANISGLNTGTVFSNLINGASNITITKKGPNANLQLNYGFALGPGEGFEGKFVIDEGAIRLINAPPIAKSTGITVNPGGQLQLGQNTTNVIPNWSMATDAVLTLNGEGKGGGINAEGALRFQLNPAASPGTTSSFDNPVMLQSDARIDVQPQPTNIADPPNTGILSNVVSGPGDLIKGGPGVLVLSNTSNNYTGDTSVQNGTLSISSAFLENAADVLLPGTTSKLDLDFTGMDEVRSFFIDGVSQLAGTWGAMGNGAADFQTDRITGTGLLDVQLFVVPGLAGDFNDDDVVDAADYVVWRDNVGTTNTLPNDNGIGGEIGTAHYELWTANFGNPPGSGAITASAAVPEPGMSLLAMLALAGVLAVVHRH